MTKEADPRTTRRVKELNRAFGSIPWLKPMERKEYRVKIFKSGNSLALRLPAELGLRAGSEMNMRVEDGEIVSLERVDAPKRKFNLAKVLGSAVNLEPVPDEDRVFDDRPLTWPDTGGDRE